MRTERFVHAGGVRARVIEEGAGYPVLLVHGLGGWAENWTLTMPELAAAGFRAIACDLPGFGRSERARDVAYFDPADPYYPRFARELLDALGIPQAHVVGHSLGGAIAAALAIQSPERVDRLVLVAPGGFGEDLGAPLRLAALPFISSIARFVPRGVVREIVAVNFSDRSRIPPWIYADAERHARAGSAAEFCRVLAQSVTVRGPRAALRQEWEARAPRLTCPTLVVWGRDDRVLPPHHATAAKRLLPHARVEMIADAGHLVMLERPSEFSHVLLAFLSEATVAAAQR